MTCRRCAFYLVFSDAKFLVFLFSAFPLNYWIYHSSFSTLVLSPFFTSHVIISHCDITFKTFWQFKNDILKIWQLGFFTIVISGKIVRNESSSLDLVCPYLRYSFSQILLYVLFWSCTDMTRHDFLFSLVHSGPENLKKSRQKKLV